MRASGTVKAGEKRTEVYSVIVFNVLIWLLVVGSRASDEIMHLSGRDWVPIGHSPTHPLNPLQ
jgi:hypothetical protein